MKVTYKVISAIIIVAILHSVPLSKAVNWIPLSDKKTTQTEIKLVAHTNDESIISFNINSYSLKRTLTEKGVAFTVEIPNGASLQQKGAPNVPKLTTSIIVPDDKKMNIEIVSTDFIEIQNIEIAPSKGVLDRTVDPSKIPFTYGTEYNSDTYFPFISAEVNTPYIMRDYRGQAVSVFPVQYNPISKILRIYKNITVKVKVTGPSDDNIINRKSNQIVTSDDFKNIYANHFLNYKEITSAKYSPLGEVGKMLIICHDAFAPTMTAFVNWKRQKGIEVELVNVSTIGNNATAIKSFVTNYYNTHGLTFLLLVGDHAQVNTSSTSAGDSDHNYAYILGTDHYADILVGRFSAETTLDANIQTERTINYEKNLTPSDTWLKTGVGIASEQGGNGQGDLDEADTVHIDFIRDTLMHHGYTTVDQLYGLSPTAAMLTTSVNSGRGIINYCGHGGDFEFVTTGFNVANVNALTNIDKQPFIFAVACVNGNFKNQTCFAEAWLRANQAGKPTGAIATAMSTINQSWESPMCGQDEMDRLAMNTMTGNTKHTFGGIVLSGIGKMIDNYSTDGENMADTWTIFGDPSLVIRTKTPQLMAVSHAPVTFIGTTSFTVNCDVNSALICLSMNGQILGTGYSNGTSATISFNAISLPDTFTVTATAQNYVTYLGQVAVVPNAGAYLVCNSQLVNDAATNNNHVAEYGESVGLDIAIKNVGVVTSNNVVATLSTSDAFVTITQNISNFGTIAASDIITNILAYNITVANNVPDGHSAIFNMEMRDLNDSVWNAPFSITLRAPSLNLQFSNVDDALGNQNSNLDPGENSDMIIKVMNNSIAASGVSSCTLSTTNSLITINNATINTGILNSNSMSIESFGVSVNAATPAGSYANFTCVVSAGNYSHTLQFTLPIGQISEDWECAGMTHFQWVNGGDLPWQIDNTEKYEGTYSLRSGPIPNAASSTDKTSQLLITINVLANDSISFFKKVSSEEQYDFLRFFIDGVQKNEWSGEVAWSKEKYPISVGSHILKWVYSKDYMTTGVQDRSWVDNIIFPPFSQATFVTEKTISELGLIAVYPNPVAIKSIVNYAWKLPETITNGTVEIVNLLGQKISTTTINQNEGHAQISTDKYSKGIYFITLKSENKTIANTKLIIE